jgi:hypothetical protein
MLMGLLREVALCCEAEQQRPARRDDAKTTDVGPDSYSSDYIISIPSGCRAYQPVSWRLARQK